MNTPRMSSRPRLERAYPFSPAKVNADTMFTRCKVAALSIRPKKWDKAHNADKLEAFFRKAAKRKPDLILATEGVLEGYVITDVIWHRERAAALLDIAEPLDGPYIARFRKLARTLQTCLCFGFAERIGREVYNSAVFIDPNGRVCGTYHKTTEGTHPSWQFWRQAKQLRAFDTPLGRCGVLICSDRWSPIVARTLVLDGAQFLLIPAYGSRSKSQNQAVLARACENGVPVVEANVGMNLVISKGEIVAYKWGLDKITVAHIDIPVRPSHQAVLACEREFRKFQRRLQQDWYRSTMAAIKKGKPSRDVEKSFVPEREFRRLQQTNWGKTDLLR